MRANREEEERKDLPGQDLALLVRGGVLSGSERGQQLSEPVDGDEDTRAHPLLRRGRQRGEVLQGCAHGILDVIDAHAAAAVQCRSSVDGRNGGIVILHGKECEVIEFAVKHYGAAQSRVEGLHHVVQV